MVSRILDQFGNPLDMGSVKEPQTSRIASLHHEFQGHPSRGLTPRKLADITDAAEQGNPIAQFELYEDMEEKDGHIASEMGKRRRALLVPWELKPPLNADATEKKNTEQLQELMQEIPDFHEVLFDTTDAIGKGFANLEIEWHQVEGYWLPLSITHRPQTWFTFYRGFRQEIRLRDGSAAGIPLQPFSWITHTHKAKSGYLERSALMRVLLWPYLFKNYSVGDLAEFLEIYGIPVRLGTYPAGASEKEKMTLLRALVNIGHNAAGIVPQGMKLDFYDPATGDPKAFQLMLDWCERTCSKAILGGTLTSQADGASSTNALGNVHNEVRKDLRDADVLLVNSTLTRDLVYSIAALNGLAPNGVRRCARFSLNTKEPGDLKEYADALPRFVGMGFRISRQWAQEQVGIPEPDDNNDLLITPTAEPSAAPGGQIPRAAATAQTPEAMLPRTSANVSQPAEAWITQLQQLVMSDQISTLEDLRDALDKLLPGLSLDEYANAMAKALAAAALAGRYEILQEAARG